MDETGNKYLTTARHCITDETGAYIDDTGDINDGAGDRVGIWRDTAAWNRPAYDITLVRPNNGQIGSSVFSGGFNSTTRVAYSGARVSPDPGGYVWVSGANSGAHVVKVVSKNAGYSVHSTPVTGGHVLADAAGSIAVAQGDSGGPTMRVVDSKDYGVGSISAFPRAHEIPCPTVAHTGVRCGSRVWYTSLTGALSAYNAHLN